MKKGLTILLTLLLVLSMSSVAFAAKGKIGVAMPTQSLQRWNPGWGQHEAAFDGSFRLRR